MTTEHELLTRITARLDVFGGKPMGVSPKLSDSEGVWYGLGT